MKRASPWWTPSSGEWNCARYARPAGSRCSPMGSGCHEAGGSNRGNVPLRVPASVHQPIHPDSDPAGGAAPGSTRLITCADARRIDPPRGEGRVPSTGVRAGAALCPVNTGNNLFG